MLGETCRGDRADGDTGGRGETTRYRRGGWRHTHTHTHTHAHTHRVSEGQWGRAGTACGDPVRAAGCPPSGTEGDAVLCPLEADHDQVGSVVPREFEGTSAADGCTRSLGGIETPGALVMARIPSASVPVCVLRVWSRCVWCRGACSPGCLNACCDARIAGVEGHVRKRPRV